MEIIDKGSHALVTEYSVGDVIRMDNSVCVIVKTPDDTYLKAYLNDGSATGGSATGGYGSLKNLYYETHVSGERKVKADVVIEGEAK